MRSKCPALKEIFIPDSIWEEFKGIAVNDMGEVPHQYRTLLAFERSCLAKITSPIHRYLLENGKPKAQLLKKDNYIKDLQECWMRKNDDLERHKKSREYRGKLTELLCAEWLESQGLSITNLEALGGAGDIEAVSSDKVAYTIEVKYLGQDDDDFLAAHSLSSGVERSCETFSISNGKDKDDSEHKNFISNMCKKGIIEIYKENRYRFCKHIKNENQLKKDARELNFTNDNIDKIPQTKGFVFL